MLGTVQKGRRVAFFGGSFDPPHRGHLAVARAARQALSLDAVLFAPVGSQPLKPRGSTASFADRLAMTRLAIAGEPGFEISLADAPTEARGTEPRQTPNYTIDTLHALRAAHPADTLFCLMGADSFRALGRWHRGAEIPFAAPLIVASRPGQNLQDLAAILPAGLSIRQEEAAAAPGAVELRTYTLRNAAGELTPFYLLPGLHEDMSASEIRRLARAAHGRPPAQTGLLSTAVAAYLVEHGLYR